MLLFRIQFVRLFIFLTFMPSLSSADQVCSKHFRLTQIAFVKTFLPAVSIWEDFGRLGQTKLTPDGRRLVSLVPSFDRRRPHDDRLTIIDLVSGQIQTADIPTANGFEISNSHIYVKPAITRMANGKTFRGLSGKGGNRYIEVYDLNEPTKLPLRTELTGFRGSEKNDLTRKTSFIKLHKQEDLVAVLMGNNLFVHSMSKNESLLRIESEEPPQFEWNPVKAELAYAVKSGDRFEMRIVSFESGVTEVNTPRIEIDQLGPWDPTGTRLSYVTSDGGMKVKTFEVSGPNSGITNEFNFDFGKVFPDEVDIFWRSPEQLEVQSKVPTQENAKRVVRTNNQGPSTNLDFKTEIRVPMTSTDLIVSVEPNKLHPGIILHLKYGNKEKSLDLLNFLMALSKDSDLPEKRRQTVNALIKGFGRAAYPRISFIGAPSKNQILISIDGLVLRIDFDAIRMPFELK